jgi:aminopeptidase N
MKEVFANFMAAKIVNPSFPEVDHDLRFLHAHYPAAYGIDRTAGANPIRQPLENLNEAGSLYGAIIYQKAPIVMKHLERLMGEETFRDGLREYLSSHRYGNATWPDLIQLLDSRTDEDLVDWSRIWVTEARRPTVMTRLEVETSGHVSTLSLAQADPEDHGRLWNQRLEAVLGYADGTVHRLPVHLRETQSEIVGAAGLPRPDYVLANGGGVGYGRFVLDAGSRDFLLEHLTDLPDARLRAVAMLSLYDGMLEGEVAPNALAWTALHAAISDDDELNAQRFLGTFEGTWWGYLSPAWHLVEGAWPAPSSTAAATAETLLWRRMEAAPEARQKAAFFNTFRDIARTPEAIDRLREVWNGSRGVDGLPLSENDRTSLAEALAVRGVTDAEAILDTQRARITNPDRRARFEFVRPSLSADAAVRTAFFERLKDPANRAHEPWVLAGLGYLHHPLRASEAERYIRPSLEMLEEIQRTGDIFFPLGWLSATLGGHSTPAAAATVETFLADHPDLPPRLRGKLLQAADPLFRASRLVAPG